MACGRLGDCNTGVSAINSTLGTLLEGPSFCFNTISSADAPAVLPKPSLIVTLNVSSSAIPLNGTKLRGICTSNSGCAIVMPVSMPPTPAINNGVFGLVCLKV